MTGVVEYVTAPEFWAGGVLLGALGSIGTYFTTKAADKRKFTHDHDMRDRQEWHEDAVLDRKEDREDKLREHENLYAVATEYTEVISDILINAMDIKGVFNMFRDAFFNSSGQADPMAKEKFDHSERVIDSNKRIGVPFNKLRLVAPTPILDAAIQLNASVLTVMRVTTEPFAMPIAYKTAGDQLDEFINVFRKEVGREEYTKSAAHSQVMTFMQNLKHQVDTYMQEAKADMRRAGFTSTPWDNMNFDEGPSL